MLAWLDELIARTCPSPPALVGHLLGGAVAARFAVDRGDRIGRLVLVDTFGLGWNRPALRFAIPPAAYIAHPTERTRDRFLGKCFVYPGLHKSLVEEETFTAAQRILRERRESQALKRGHPADYLLSGVVRCGQCGRAFIGTAATGRSRRYHYYACSTRYRYGTRKLRRGSSAQGRFEEAVLEQMIEIYRDSGLIAEVLAQLQLSERDERQSVASRVVMLRQEQAGARRSMDRYFAAFEAGTMKPSTCQERLDGLQTRLDALIAEEQALLAQEEAEAPPTPELLAEWARTLDVALYSGTAQQRKALIRKLVKELKVMSRHEIIPMYRLPALVRAPGHQVELPGIEPGSPDAGIGLLRA